MTLELIEELKEILEQHKAFKGHKGRLGKVGGSLPQGQSSVSVLRSPNATEQDWKYMKSVADSVFQQMPSAFYSGAILNVVHSGNRATSGGKTTSKFGTAMGAINIPANGMNGKRHSEHILKDVIAHEIGHRVWNRLMDESKRGEWVNAAKQIGLASSSRELSRDFPYLNIAWENNRGDPKKFASEVFAELFGAYYSDRRDLVKRYFPSRFEVLDSLDQSNN